MDPARALAGGKPAHRRRIVSEQVQTGRIDAPAVQDVVFKSLAGEGKPQAQQLHRVEDPAHGIALKRRQRHAGAHVEVAACQTP